MLSDLVECLVTLVASLLPEPRVIYSLDGVSPYLSRYYIFGRPKMADGSSPFDRFGNPKKDAIWSDGPGLYLHRFHRSDEEPELHNHPFENSASLVLVGGYTEERRVGRNVERRELRPGDVNIIGHDTFHRVELSKGEAWSLFAVTRKSQSWGFFDVRFNEYKSHRDFFESRSKAKRAKTHCPECDAVFSEDEKPDTTWHFSDVHLITRKCKACRVKERADRLEDAFAKATKVSLAGFEAARDGRALVSEEREDQAFLPETETDPSTEVVAGRYDVERLRRGAMALRDGTRFLWSANPFRATVNLAEECNESWLSDHHESAGDWVDYLKIEAAQKLVNEALADVVTYDEDTSLAVVLPPLEVAP